MIPVESIKIRRGNTIPFTPQGLVPEVPQWAILFLIDIKFSSVPVDNRLGYLTDTAAELLFAYHVY